MNTTTSTASTSPRRVSWTAMFETALRSAAAKCGQSLDGLRWERCTIDQTWGDRCGLVFFGSSAKVNERAAKFFEAWADKNLRKLGAVGGYETQESIRFAGLFHFSEYSNGAKGWHRGPMGEAPAPRTLPGCGDFILERTKAHEGYATSYVYYPCAA